MSELDNKIKKFKELSDKSKSPHKVDKLNLFVTLLLVTLLFIQAINVYIYTYFANN